MKRLFGWISDMARSDHVIFRVRRNGLALLLVLWVPPPTAIAQDRPVDLELVLSVDASGSVDDDEYELQLGGIAEAFRDPLIHRAIADGKLGAIAVAVVVWADALRPKAETEWFYLSSPTDALDFANHVAIMPRTVLGSTGIGAGLAWSIRKMERNGYQGWRQVVDVSGDGRETPPRDVTVLIDQARAMAASRNVTVNGLAILSDEPDLDRWYAEHVQTGPGSFVMSVANFDEFARAMRLKLIKEIRGPSPLAMAPSTAQQP